MKTHTLILKLYYRMGVYIYLFIRSIHIIHIY